jgi:hypothetical protein
MELAVSMQWHLLMKIFQQPKRLLIQGIINVGYSTCQIICTPLYILPVRRRFIFWLENIIVVIFGVMLIIVREN